jgi:hypothetical protein
LPRLRVGYDAEAARLNGAITASATASPLAGADAARITEAVATMRARLGDERFEAAQAKGTALSDSEAVAFALECVGGRSDGLPGGAGRPVTELTAQ